MIASYSPEMNKDINLLDLTGMDLTNIEILPHYNKFLSRFERFEEKAKEYEKKTNSQVIRLNDGQGIIVHDEGYTLL